MQVGASFPPLSSSRAATLLGWPGRGAPATCLRSWLFRSSRGVGPVVDPAMALRAGGWRRRGGRESLLGDWPGHRGRGNVMSATSSESGVVGGEVAARDAVVPEGHLCAVQFPGRESAGDSGFEPRRSVKAESIVRLGGLDFVEGKENVVLLGPSGTGKTRLAVGLANRACLAGYRVAFASAAQWAARLARAHAHGELTAELSRIGRIPLVVVDEVGSVPFEPEAANLLFLCVSGRCERASTIVTSDKPFGRWGEVFGDDDVAAAMIDRLSHHSEVISFEDSGSRVGGCCSAGLAEEFARELSGFRLPPEAE